MSTHHRPAAFRRRAPVSLPTPAARAVPVNAISLSRRTAHYRSLDDDGRSGRFNGATGADRVADWAAQTVPALMLFAGSLSDGWAPQGLAEIHLCGEDGTDGELALSVLPLARGRGHGRALIAAAIAAARAAGLKHLELDYAARNTALARLMLEQHAEITGDGADRVAILDLETIPAKS